MSIRYASNEIVQVGDLVEWDETYVNNADGWLDNRLGLAWRGTLRVTACDFTITAINVKTGEELSVNSRCFKKIDPFVLRVREIHEKGK